ncbi:MAG TPA: helix-turn-helix domain-containing protein [Patescibacteria group bacterium]|jgi:DNA-binding HxlR family transcriptional regulator|nr:helix-turn-helix domain-containing protein [Patescibacteria group bacterium]
MDSQLTDSQTCLPSLKLLGDFWTLRIIDILAPKALRFVDIQRSLDNINPSTLSDRLKRMEEASLVKRTEESRTEVRYELTALGQESLPVIEAINRFSAKVNQPSR